MIGMLTIQLAEITLIKAVMDFEIKAVYCIQCMYSHYMKVKTFLKRS